MSKKIIGIFLLAICLLVAVYPKAPFATGRIKDGLVYETLGLSPDTQAVYVDNVKVSLDIYLYWLCRSAKNAEKYFEDKGEEFDWFADISDGVSTLDYVKQDTLNSVRYFAVIEKMAKENGIKLSKEDKETLKSQKDAHLETMGGQAEYDRQIALLGVTQKSYERINQTGLLYSDLYDSFLTEGSSLYPEDRDVAEYAAAQGAMTADHILLMTIDPDTKQPYPQEVIDEKCDLAEELHHRLIISDDLQTEFKELADEYSEDVGREQYPDGYTFMPGVMIPVFENTAKELNPGELSEIVESVYGFHIILRKELDVTDAAAGMRNIYFEALIAARVNGAELECNPILDTIDIPSYYEAFCNAQLQSKQQNRG